MSERIKLKLHGADGQTFVEYAVILAGVVVGVLFAASWTGVGAMIQTAINAVTTAV